MSKRKFAVLLLLVLGLLPGTLHAQPTPVAVASFSILADVVATVAGDHFQVVSVMPVGADPHAFTPTASDLAALANADVVFVNGAFFEEGLMEAIENAGAEMNIVVASNCVPILPIGAGHQHEEGEEDHDNEAEATAEALTGDLSAVAAQCEQHYAEMAAIHEAGHAAEGEEHEGEEHEGHAHVEALGPLYALECTGHEGEEHSEEEGEHAHEEGSCDPHVWQEPHNVIYWTMMIRDTLVALDPANADAYSANAAAYIAALDTLAHDFVMPMVATVPEANRLLVTSHDAFGYFAARYGFEIAGVVLPGGSTLAEPSAGDLAALIETINAEGIQAIFAETTVNPQLVEQVAAETDAQVYVLYSGSLSPADGPAATYLDLIRYNVTTIVNALGGGM